MGMIRMPIKVADRDLGLSAANFCKIRVNPESDARPLVVLTIGGYYTAEAQGSSFQCTNSKKCNPHHPP